MNTKAIDRYNELEKQRQELTARAGLLKSKLANYSAAESRTKRSQKQKEAEELDLTLRQLKQVLNELPIAEKNAKIAMRSWGNPALQLDNEVISVYGELLLVERTDGELFYAQADEGSVGLGELIPQNLLKPLSALPVEKQTALVDAAICKGGAI